MPKVGTRTEVSEAVAKIKELAHDLLAAIHDDLGGKELKFAVVKAATDIHAAADKLVAAASGDFQPSR